MEDDGWETTTSVTQIELENKVAALYSRTLDVSKVPLDADNEPALSLARDAHVAYCHRLLRDLPAGFASLDASRPWIAFWLLHSLALLEAPLPSDVSKSDLVQFLRLCQDAEHGGFAGGPRQLPHLAATYAAVAAAVTLGPEALEAIDRPALQSFLNAMADAAPNGGFRVHPGGEVDIRGTYTALAAARLAGLDVAALAKRSRASKFIAACQTYEGGIAGEPGAEAHGGYAYCGLAAAILADEPSALDLRGLRRWAAGMQGAVEGGFAGRTNKLVDGCYSFWTGALFPLLHALPASDVAAAARPTARGPAPDAIPGLPPAFRGGEDPDRDPVSRMSGGEDLDRDPGPRMGVGANADGSGDHGAGDGGAPPQQGETDCTGSADGTGSRGAVGIAHPRVRAASAARRARAAADAARERAMALYEGGGNGGGGDGGSWGAGVMEAAVNEAAEAADASERAAEHARAVAASAAALVGVSGGEGGGGGRLFDSAPLQLWVLAACQEDGCGGLRDKPGKGIDPYHTCYCLSGLAAAQAYDGVLGPATNRLAHIDPVLNVTCAALEAADAHWERAS